MMMMKLLLLCNLTCIEVIGVVNACAIHPLQRLLQYAPHVTVNRIQIMAVGRS